MDTTKLGTDAAAAQVATITVPLCGREGYVPRRLALDLSQDHAVTMMRVTTGLQESHATLRNGRHVDTSADALRWMLEQVEAAVTKRGGKSR